MVLMMARPFKHPTTGVYYYRRGVPEELRPLVGRREEKVSLGTKDLNEAKRLHAQKAAEVEARWANLLKPLQTMSEREAHLAAMGHFEAYLSAHSDNPSQAPWQPSIGETLWRTIPWEELATKVMSPDYLSTPDVAAVERARYEAHCLTEADRYLAACGLRVDEQGKSNLAKAIGSALQRAALALRDVSAPHWAFPVAVPRSNLPGSADRTVVGGSRVPSSVTFSSLVAGWTKEKQPTKKTAYSWTRVVDDLQNFLGYDDAQRMTSDDLVRWKASLIERELSTKTIRDGKIAPVRAILQWGLDNRHISANVAERLTVKVKIRPGSKKRGFTEEEAKLVLRTAAFEKVLSMRWVPWICAYTGARVSEICQLRSQDVFNQDDIWLIRITGEAGSIKNENSERLVPLHKALLNEGFLDFAKRLPSGPLFNDLKPDRFGNRGGTGTKIIGRWIRKLGITDARISPNHSWRHRFKTVCRQHEVDLDIAEALTGHGRKSEGDKYGDFTPRALLRGIAKFPTINLK